MSQSPTPTPATATATETKNIIRPFFDAITDLACHLAERWADEEEYEDIEDYKKVLQEACAPFGVTVTRMLRRPFGFVFTTPALSQPWALKILARKIRCAPVAKRAAKSVAKPAAKPTTKPKKSAP